jgi:hypothetical protein
MIKPDFMSSRNVPIFLYPHWLIMLWQGLIFILTIDPLNIPFLE